MALIEQVGDLFNSDAPALGHGCNCAGAMGRGIALEFRRRWPEMYDYYREECRSGQFVLGSVLVWETPGRTIFNLATQATWRTRASLDAIEQSVSLASTEAARRGIDSIAIPRIGAGLGRLDWVDVANRIDRASGDHVDFHAYTPAPAG